MLSGSYKRSQDDVVYFIEGARPQWGCQRCGDRDRLFFVIGRRRNCLEKAYCLPCVLRYSYRYPEKLIAKLDDFVVMERLRDANRKEEEGV